MSELVRWSRAELRGSGSQDRAAVGSGGSQTDIRLLHLDEIR